MLDILANLVHNLASMLTIPNQKSPLANRWTYRTHRIHALSVPELPEKLNSMSNTHLDLPNRQTSLTMLNRVKTVTVTILIATHNLPRVHPNNPSLIRHVLNDHAIPGVAHLHQLQQASWTTASIITNHHQDGCQHLRVHQNLNARGRSPSGVAAASASTHGVFWKEPAVAIP